jgi:MSHA biogenesis protein MshP
VNRAQRRHRRERGTSLVVAIFLIVVIAALSAFAVTAGTSTRASANLALQADRALAAARAGTEWAAYRALRQNVCNVGTAPPFTINQGALRGFRVTVTVTDRTDHTVPPGLTYFVCDVSSFAQRGNFGEADYASRTVIGRFSNAP